LFRTGIPALPFCHLTLRAQKPSEKPYPASLDTWGDHIRKKRLDLDLFQKQAADLMGVDEATVYNWENHRKFAGLLKVDPSTLAKWEQGKSEPRGSYLAMVNAFLNHGRQSRRPQAVFPRPGRQAGDTRLLR